jgi:hypothetical protein
MKILYFPIIDKNNIHTNGAGDYQADSLFHGLRTLLGEDVVDTYKMWHLYEDADPDELKNLWGKGFTMYGLLPDQNIDRDDIHYKILRNYYDYLVIPIHHTENGHYDLIGSVVETFRLYYPKNKIVLVDGWDRSEFDKDIAKKCLYFKREMSAVDSKLVNPISFSIPEEKIQEPLEKTIDFAPLIPCINQQGVLYHDDTYIYEDEQSYYDDYRRSFFAYTCKKGRNEVITEGWDCMRHYEILACGCIPFFTDVEKCPEHTLRRFPVDLCEEVKKMKGVFPGTKSPYNPEVTTYIGTAEQILKGDKRGRIDFDKFDQELYNDINANLMAYTRKHLTTVGTAKNFLNRLKEWD